MQIITDADGKFRFENLSAGDYRIKVEANGFSVSNREIKIENAATDNLEIVLTVGNIAETVTVTATRTQISTDETDVPVSVVGREEIKRKAVNTIGDVFRTLPGASTVGEGAFQVRPRIRGLDSNRVLVLVDGERLNNSRTSTGMSGVETGLVETSQIETLEVVRGSGSVLYGTDALGGTSISLPAIRPPAAKTVFVSAEHSIPFILQTKTDGAATWQSTVQINSLPFASRNRSNDLKIISPAKPTAQFRKK